MKSIKSYFKKTPLNENNTFEGNKEVIDNEIKYLLNDKNMTASVSNGSKTSGNIYIPRIVIYKNEEYLVTNILKRAFYLSKIKSVTFPNDSELKHIENESFLNCPIEKISIPAHVTEIGTKAFYNCRKFNSIQFQSNSELKTIGTGAFAYTNFQKIEIPSSVMEINDVAFFDSCLENIFIPKDSKLEIIGEQAFCNTEIKELFIPEHLKEIKYGSLINSKLININISPNNKHFTNLLNDKNLVYKSDKNNGAFDVLIWGKRNLTEIVIPSFVKKIDDFAFQFCYNLQKISFSDYSELKSLGNCSFASCKMSSISLPKNVAEIGHDCFSYCEYLKIIEFPEISHIQSLIYNIFTYTNIEVLMVPSNNALI